MTVPRRAGQILLLGALLIAAWDGFTSYHAGVLSLTKVRDFRPGELLPNPLMSHRLGDEHSPIKSWDTVVSALPDWPAVLLLGLLGLGLWLIGRRRPGSAPAPASKLEEDSREASATAQRRAPAGSELRKALWSCRNAFLGTAGFSLIINILMLTGAIFMLEIYDRVLPSRSVATLIGLSIVAAILFTALGLLDVIRGRLLVRAGGAIDEALAARVFDVLVRLPVRAGNRGDGLQPLRDLDAIRSFLSGPGPTALFDLPWLPFYLAIVYAFHPVLGLTALVGAIVLIALTLLTEALSRRPARDSTIHVINRHGVAEACLRNAEVVAGMGFAPRLGNLWRSSNDRALASQRRASDIAGGLGAIARVLRMILQSAVLAVGAYLVIIQQASAGIIIAGSILTARALAPVDVAIANWRGFVAARQSWERLGRLLVMLPAQPRPMPLSRAVHKLQVENVIVVPPGEQKVVVRDVGFALTSGRGSGSSDRSGSGKSSLARVLVGAWTPLAGRIRLDGSALDQWVHGGRRTTHRLPAAGCRTLRRQRLSEHRTL